MTPPASPTLKGLVLAGGAGTRLRPITHTSAKQLVPVANRPVLFYGLAALADAGIGDVGIIVGDTEHEIRAAVGDGSQWGITVTYLRQDAPLGLAHAVLTAADFLAGSPFVMYLGDNLLRDGIQPLVEQFREQQPDAAILLTEVDDPSSYGVAELNGERIVRLVEKPADPPSNMALVGVYAFSPKIVDAARAIEPSARGELEITDAIQHIIDGGGVVTWRRVDGWWKDTGRLDDMLEANRLILDRLEPAAPPAVGDDVSIEGRVVIQPGAVIERSRIRGPAIIGEGAVVRDSFVGPYTSIAAGCVVEDAEVEHSILLEGSSVRGLERRLVDSMLGRDVVVEAAPRSPIGSIMLMVGDSSHARV